MVCDVCSVVGKWAVTPVATRAATPAAKSVRIAPSLWGETHCWKVQEKHSRKEKRRPEPGPQ